MFILVMNTELLLCNGGCVLINKANRDNLYQLLLYWPLISQCENKPDGFPHNQLYAKPLGIESASLEDSTKPA